MTAPSDGPAAGRTRVLVTGATGLCGAAVAAHLRARGGELEVTTLSRRAGGAGHLAHDLALPLAPGVAPGAVDWVIHCAAQVDERDPGFDVVERNLRMAFHAGRYAVQAGARFLVNLSSVAVYGTAERGGAPLDEDAPPAPRTSYGLAKRLVEEALDLLPDRTFDVAHLRLGYVLAPRVPDRYVIPRLAARLAAGEPVELVNPDATRFPFVDAACVASVCERLAAAGRGGVYHVVGDEAPSVREVLDAIRALRPGSTSAVTERERPAEAYRLTFANRRVKEAAGLARFQSWRDSLAAILSGGGCAR